MKTIIYFLLIALCVISCSDKDETNYERILTLSGNTSDYFSNLGEERELSVTYTSTPAISNADAQNLLNASEITFTSGNHHFTFSDYTISGNQIKFNVISPENKTGNIVEDKISVRIENTQFNLEVGSDLKQLPSDIRYEYKIESGVTGSYTIPAAGGRFTIPIRGKRQTYINNILEAEVPYSLKGLHFISNNVNTAWKHNTLFIFEENLGEYTIQLTAEPYNFEGEYLWTVEFRNEEKILYHLDIFHLQTPGEEYYMPYTKTNSQTIYLDE